MAKKEKMSEERKELIQEFISNNELKDVTDIQNAIKICLRIPFKKCLMQN